MGLDDQVAAQSKQTLLAGLDFRAPDSASYILSRDCQYFPCQTGSPYSPGATRLIRIHLAEANPCKWLDLSTLRISFLLKNTAAAGQPSILLASGPWCLFQRVRILARGVVAEDRMYYGREHEIYHRLRESTRNKDDLNEWPWTEPIAADSYKRISFVPMLGLLQQPLMWLLEMAPLTFELEVTPTMASALTRDTNAGTWEITDPYILCDTLHLDPGFCQQYSSSIMAGTPLSYHFSGASTMSFVVPGAAGGGQVTEFSIQLARSFTHLKTLIITFYRDPTAPVTANYTGVTIDPANLALTPTPAGGTEVARYASFKNMDKAQADIEQYRRMNVNTYFHNPSADTPPTTEFECQVVMGAKVFPVMPLKGNTQAYYNLRKSLSQTEHGYTDITREQFMQDSFILPINLEKARFGNGGSHASFSGLSSMGGETMQIMFKNIAGVRTPQTVWVTLLYDAALNVRADGCEVQI